jgi:chaperone required for assembly of F1-ATPase
MNGGDDTPQARVRRAAMRAPTRRSYRKVSVAEGETGHAVLLDERPIRTPGRAPLRVPAKALAEAIAAEWRQQAEHIDPATMPLTRLANSIIDGVARARGEVVADIVAYAGSDLLCYRAGEPEGLVARQRQAWDPVLDWAAADCGIDLVRVAGVQPHAQPERSLNIFRQQIENESDFVLGVLADMTALMGSALLALAVLRGRLSAGEAWAAAHVDEDWQISRWGEDAAAAHRRRLRWRDMEAAALMVALAQCKT